MHRMSLEKRDARESREHLVVSNGKVSQMLYLGKIKVFWSTNYLVFLK
jgi:hypothetical protein